MSSSWRSLPIRILPQHLNRQLHQWIRGQDPITITHKKNDLGCIVPLVMLRDFPMHEFIVLPLFELPSWMLRRDHVQLWLESSLDAITLTYGGQEVAALIHPNSAPWLPAISLTPSPEELAHWKRQLLSNGDRTQ
jgi:hypothetical protein